MACAECSEEPAGSEGRTQPWTRVRLTQRAGLKYKDRSQVRAVSRDQTHDTESPRLIWMRPRECLTRVAERREAAECPGLEARDGDLQGVCDSA